MPVNRTGAGNCSGKKDVHTPLQQLEKIVVLTKANSAISRRSVVEICPHGLADPAQFTTGVGPHPRHTQELFRGSDYRIFGSLSCPSQCQCFPKPVDWL
jgi:hypothetical protein